MKELDKLYLAILESGLVAIRNASHDGNLEYIRQEAEHLHEIPSLLEEVNSERHLYYFDCVRQAYLEWISSNAGDAARELVDCYYAAPWKEMAQILHTMRHSPR